MPRKQKMSPQASHYPLVLPPLKHPPPLRCHCPLALSLGTTCGVPRASASSACSAWTPAVTPNAKKVARIKTVVHGMMGSSVGSPGRKRGAPPILVPKWLRRCPSQEEDEVNLSNTRGRAVAVIVAVTTAVVAGRAVADAGAQSPLLHARGGGCFFCQ